MKNLITITAIVISSISLRPQEQMSTLSLTIDNVKDQKATLYVGFYRANNKFPKHGQHAFRKVVPANGTNLVNVTWTDIPTGEYSLAVYHDLNGNDKLETGMFGIPKEPSGLSTNLKAGIFNLPTFDKCKVRIEGNTTLTISLR